jgi:Xaa-Pro aminopeptidase
VIDTDVVAEKSRQATEVLREQDVDAWLTFARETTEIADPCLPYVLGFDVVWPTVVLFTQDGDSHVILGRHDAPNAEHLGVHEVHAYDESLREPLLDVLDATVPDEIAINYSKNVNTADGLTHGLYRRLVDLLDGTGYADRLVSAESVVGQLRGVKSPTERERVVAAAERTEALFEALAEAWEPSWSERTVSDWLHARMREEDLGSAWSWDYCPTVHHGGASEVGHTLPGDLTLPEGEVLHLDFGVRQDGYAADVQRLYFRGDRSDIPEELQSAFDDVRSAIETGKAALEPGVAGHEVDTAARERFLDLGRPEFMHGFGHQVGRRAHDGGTLLCPLWDRYGDAPRGTVRAGEIYTLELGVETEWGYVGLEEMVEVTADGAEYLVEPQRQFRTLSG